MSADKIEPRLQNLVDNERLRASRLDVASDEIDQQAFDVIISHAELQGFRRWVLATKDAHELYRKYGFEGLKQPVRWMERHDPKTIERPDYRA